MRASNLGVVREKTTRPVIRMMQIPEMPPSSVTVCSRVSALYFAFAILYGSGFLTAAFNHVIEKDVSYAYFLAVVVGHGGNIGGQTVAKVVQKLACGDDCDNGVVWSEASFSILSTIPVAVASVGIAALANVAWEVYLTTALSLLLVSLLSSIAGSSSCLLSQRTGRDPAIFAPPFVTTFVDVCGTLIYFSFAMLIDS